MQRGRLLLQPRLQLLKLRVGGFDGERFRQMMWRALQEQERRNSANQLMAETPTRVGLGRVIAKVDFRRFGRLAPV